MILTVTFNPAVDHTLEIDGTLSNDGAVTRARHGRYDAGGKGINVSKYLVELGTDTVATGVLGGFLGDFVREQLAAREIPHDFVDIDGLTRLNTTILGDAEYKVNQSGPTVGPAAVDAIIETIEFHDPEMVVIAGSLPPGLETSAIDDVSRAGDWQTVVDVGGAALASLEARYAVCKPNREELAGATGRTVGTVDDCIDAATALRDQGFENVLASLGADGAIMASDGAVLHAPSLDVDVIDTVGAGDALLAGVLSALDGGSTPEDALARGILVASRVVEVAGTGVPSLSFEGEDDAAVPVSVR